jgi:signal transduction histidine kinase
MTSWIFGKKSNSQTECIEEVFFRTILVICVLTCAMALLFDFLLAPALGFNTWLTFLFLQVLVLGWYSFKKIRFEFISIPVLGSMDILITYRGLLVPEYYYLTCSLLITIGFLSSIVCIGISRQCLRILVLCSLLLALFQNTRGTDLILSLRLAIPYLMMYSIVTISSGILKDRYERHQKRLVELVELLNQKNAKISKQHHALTASYAQLANLNANLEEAVKVKTWRIEQKNLQLADLANANAHRVRGPLARILGLLHLIELDPHKKDCYLHWIHNEAKQLDDITSVLGRSIERNIAEA